MADLIETRPIDDDARTGTYQLVFGAGQFAIARWQDERWAFSSGRPIGFEPEEYRPHGR